MSTTEETPADPPKLKKRRGPPPGTRRKRHDPTPAPIDGDYAPLDIAGKNPAFEYFAYSASDMERRFGQYEIEKWSENCAHSPWAVFTEELRGKPVTIRGQLTLVRIPRERIEARRRRERADYLAISRGQTNDEVNARGFKVTESATTQTFNVSKSY